MPKISIIVPVYKAEKYIRRCVDSIIAQTYSDWELLLLDDGSPDCSGEICDEYAQRDHRVKVFHKGNGGVSSARNLGLDNAQGQYLTFVDADDWIDADNLAICLSIIEKNHLDVLQFPFKRIDERGNILQTQQLVPTDVLDLSRYITNRHFNLCVGGAYMKNSIVQENHIRFEEDLKLAEDQIFMMTVMLNSERLQAIDSVYYNYYFNSDSATNNEQIKDIIRTSYRGIEFKQQYPLFAVRMDGLVLWFIEKLLWRHCCGEACRILSALKPEHYKDRPWPTAWMVNVSKCSVRFAVAIWIITYPVYALMNKVDSIVRNRFK